MYVIFKKKIQEELPLRTDKRAKQTEKLNFGVGGRRYAEFLLSFFSFSGGVVLRIDFEALITS